MSTVGWIKIEQKLGKPTWHYFDGITRLGSIRKKSLCGQIRLYVIFDAETRHITEAGNCSSCAKILKKKGGE